jgi:predicted RNase H-like nuclease (RuvC/YqgF family)
MQLKKRQITARIPEELYEKCNAKYDNMTDAVIAGLEMLCNAECNANNANCNAEEVKCNASCNANEVNCNANCNADESTINELNTQIEEKTAKVQELQDINETLTKEIENIKNNNSDNKESLQLQIRIQEMQERLKEKDESQQERIVDLKEEITVLRKQLDTKDDTIKNLTTITESQLKGYKLIEAPGAKKPWWRFW